MSHNILVLSLSFKMLNQYAEPSVFCVEHSQTVEPIPDQGRGQVL